MNRHRLPVRIRLTCWYGVTTLLVVAVLAALVFGMLRWRLLERFDENLLADAEQALLETGEGSLADAGWLADTIISSELSDTSFGFMAIESTGSAVHGCGDASGDPAATQSCIEAETIAAASSVDILEETEDGEVTFLSTSDDGADYRSVVVPVYRDDTVVGALLVTRSRETVRETLREMGNVLAIASPLLIGLAAAIGYLLAGRALRPVSQITSLAGSVSADQLHQRLDLDLPNDELGKLAQTFDDMLARIEDAFERQKRFTGDAAHELRTPLSLIRGQVDLALARPREPEAYRDALRQLDTDLVRLTGTVDSLLALARTESGKLSPERQLVDLGAMAETVVVQFQDMAERQGVTLGCSIDPVSFHADEDMLVQVLVNLVDNAVRHTPAGGTVTVITRKQATTAEFTVSDTGTGIAPEHQSRVFDRFYRAEPAAGGGSGFGLAIAKAIVDAHGGTITLTSEIGRGTSVTVQLPQKS